MDKIPSINSLKSLKNGSELKDKLEKSDPLAYPLFRWILSTNRAHFAKVLDKHVRTFHFFLMKKENFWITK